MDAYKLRIKIGSHEFEAEGPKDAVTAQFEAWKELIVSLPAVQSQEKNARIPPSSLMELRTGEGSVTSPWDIFEIDEKRNLVSLKVHPTGDQRDADAVLLILYGYRRALGQNDALVTRLKESMEVSGLRPGRIDRAVVAHIRSGFLMKAGRGKGGKYRLTNTGVARVEEMARGLVEQLA